MADLKLAGMVLKQPKMLRKHQKFIPGDQKKISDVFFLPFLTPK